MKGMFPKSGRFHDPGPAPSAPAVKAIIAMERKYGTIVSPVTDESTCKATSAKLPEGKYGPDDLMEESRSVKPSKSAPI